MKSAYERSLNILNYKAKTEYALRERLAELGHGADDIDKAILKLKELRYIDDEAYINAFAEESVLKQRGRRRISRDLEKVGFDRDEIEQVLEVQLPRELEYKNAEDVRDRILGKISVGQDLSREEMFKQKDKAYRKVVSKLNSLGYENDLIYNVAAEVGRIFDENQSE